MQFKTLSLVALSATGAVAQLNLPTGSAALSVISVLQTAIPASVQSYVFNSPSAFISEVASSIAMGQTPSWYAALPTDVKSALPSLFPVAATPAITTTATVAATTATATETSVSVSVSVSRNSTSVTTVRTPTLSSLSRTSTGAGSSPTSSSSSGGASYPTAVVGAGFAGALGVIGMLAL